VYKDVLQIRQEKNVNKALVCIFMMLSSAAAAIEIPVSDRGQWTSLSFRNIPANTVTVDDGNLQISVNSSASPLVHKLNAPLAVTSVAVKARWSGKLNIPQDAVQGESGADDFVLKLGIVEAGDRTLNWVQRRIAADWIQQLFKLAPKGTGVSRIHFLSTFQQQDLLGSQRIHPLSDLLYETRTTYLESPGEFEMVYQFEEPVEVLGLWISSDGDDTGSSFDLSIEQITLNTD
jgi:hypothetical protein